MLCELVEQYERTSLSASVISLKKLGNIGMSAIFQHRASLKIGHLTPD